jgi:steroid 5-alpha reductase family enzyme
MHGAPRLPLLLASLGTSLACAAPLLNDTHVAVTYGYGASLMCQSLLFSATRTVWPSTGAVLLLLVYLLYGIKMCVFQALRDTTPGYVAKVLQPARDDAAWRLSRRRAASGPARWIPPRLPFVLSFGLLLSAFCFPLNSAVTAAPRRTLGVALGALTALAGLALQSVADGQKFNFKQQYGADELCTRGLWSLSRHPNYLGEIVFHAGVLLAGLMGARNPSAAFLSSLAPAVFIRIMHRATVRLEGSQLAFYE